MILIFLCVGLFTGTVAGLLGIGGGVIAVPALYYILGFYGVPPERIMHVAAATALASTFIASASSSCLFCQRKEVDPYVIGLTIPGMVLGCGLGIFSLTFLSTLILRTIFGVIALIFSAYYFFPHLPEMNLAPAPNRWLILLGFIFGMLSALLGVGSGLFMFPVLLGYHLATPYAAGTACMTTLLSAFVASIGYFWISQGEVSAPYSFGYIQIPAFLAIGFSSFFTALIGAKFTHIFPIAHLKRVFAVALALTGAAMILGK